MEEIEEIAKETLGWPERRKWNSIDNGPIESGGGPKHLLWALIHLKWAWYFVRRIAELKDELISLDNIFNGLNGMYSHKFNGLAVKYEVGVCLKTGWIVWINGPFFRSKNDGTIFKEGLSNLLHDNKAVEVDRGYRGDDKMKLPDMGQGMMQQKHKICFEAVAVITQLKFASGETTFEDGLEYDVNYF
eukprot:jgi/Psemu1/26047/gm1.26047_g